MNTTYEYQAILNHLCSSPSAQLHAIMLFMNQGPYLTLDSACTDMVNVMCIRDYRSVSNSGSDCPVVIWLQRPGGHFKINPAVLWMTSGAVSASVRSSAVGVSIVAFGPCSIGTSIGIISTPPLTEMAQPCFSRCKKN